MRRTYVYKLKPTRRQEAVLVRYLNVTRDLYNAALEQRRMLWREHRASTSFTRQSREIKTLREDPQLARVLDGLHVHPLQEALRQLDRTFEAFYRRHPGGKTPGYPRFKSARRWGSFRFKEEGNGFRLDTQARRLRIAGVGHVKVRLHRQPDGEVKTCSIVRKPDGWHVHLVCERPTPRSQRGGERCALDLGVEALATLHTGERIDGERRDQQDAPSFDERHARAERKLRAEQRALSRRTRGSRRRGKQARRLARAHLKLARVRRDAHHKLARALVDRYSGGIAVEDLRVANMVRSAKGTLERPGRNVKQKAALNRAILNAGWAQFIALLAAKAEEAGSPVIYVDPRGGSQECSRCGANVPKRLSERLHHCGVCGLHVHRDHNAALNYYHRAWAASVAEAAIDPCGSGPRCEKPPGISPERSVTLSLH